MWLVDENSYGLKNNQKQNIYCIKNRLRSGPGRFYAQV